MECTHIGTCRNAKIQVRLCIDGYLELRRRLMKTVFLHGLGQTAQDWKEVVQQLSISDVDCAPIKTSESTFFSCRIAKSIARSAPNERPQIRSGSFTSEYRCSKSPKICE